MTTDNLAVIQNRAVSAEALARGDNDVANLAYAAELAALAETGDDAQPGGSQTVATVEDNDANHVAEDTGASNIANVFDHLTREFGEEQVASLRSHWVDDDAAHEGIALGQALAIDHPELIRIAEEFGLADHPGILAMAAAVARASGYRFDATGAKRSATQQETTPMQNNMSRENFAKSMRDFNERIALAQSEGDSKRADEIYAKQQDWIGRVKGNRTIVGGRGRQNV